MKIREITVQHATPGETVEGFFVGLDGRGYVRLRNPSDGHCEVIIGSHILRNALRSVPWRREWIRVTIVGVEKLSGERMVMRVNCERGPAPLGARGRLRRMKWRL